MPIVDHERLTCFFFRRVNSVELFQRFFEKFKVWESMGLDDSSSNDEVYEAWNELECPNRPHIEEALQCINDIGREKARFTLTERAKECRIENYKDLTVQKLAMTLFLDHRDEFDQAYRFYMLEKTEKLYNLMGETPTLCHPSAGNIARFKEQLAEILRREAYGPRLLVEVEGRHDGKWMAAIPHQTYVKPDHEFNEDNEIVTRDRHPIYEMILVYYPDNGLLRLKAGRGRKKIKRVAAAFARGILGQDNGFFAPCDIVNFEALKEDGFSFQPEPRDEFQWAKPVKVTFWKRSDPGTDYEIQCKDRRNRTNVLKEVEANGTSLSEIEITSLSICFKFPTNKRDTRTVELAKPNRVSLDETARDRYIEKVLTRWELLDYEAGERLPWTGLSRQALRRRVLRRPVG